MKDRILTKNPVRGKQGVNISFEKYGIVKEAIIEELLRKGEMSFNDLSIAVNKKLKGRFEGSISWYFTFVKLDLVAKKIIERDDSSRLQVLRLTGNKTK